MTTLRDRPGAALLVIDVQNAVVGEAFNRQRVVGNVATLLAKARAAHTTVVWVQHNAPDLAAGSAGWQIVDELDRDPSEPVVQKEYADAFEDTDLEIVLAQRGVGRLVVCGAQTDECIRSTLHGAIARGYDALLVEDAHTTDDLSSYGAPTPDKVIAHTNLYWSYHRAPGRSAGTVGTDAIDFAALPAEA